MRNPGRPSAKTEHDRSGAPGDDVGGNAARRHTVLIVAFRRQQQWLVAQWLPWLTELERSCADVSIHQPTAQAPADARELMRDLGLPTRDTIAIALLDRYGRIVAQETGAFDDAKAERLTTALSRATIADRA